METRRGLSLVLVVALLGSAFSVPVAPRLRRALDENELKETEDDEPLTYPPPVRQYFPDPVPLSPNVLKDIFGPPPPSSDSTAITSATSTTSSTSTSSTIRLDDDDDDDSDSDEFEPMNTSQTIGGGGSNLFSLLRLAGPLLSGSSGNGQSSSSESNSASGIFSNFKADIFRAVLQFAASLFGLASSTSSGASSASG